jgi:hypothetical protein
LDERIFTFWIFNHWNADNMSGVQVMTPNQRISGDFISVAERKDLSSIMEDAEPAEMDVHAEQSPERVVRTKTGAPFLNGQASKRSLKIVLPGLVSITCFNNDFHYLYFCDTDRSI